MKPKQRALLHELAAYPYVVYPLRASRWNWSLLSQFVRRYVKSRRSA